MGTVRLATPDPDISDSDPTGELAARRAEMSHYPPALAQAQQRGLWEADFCVGIARKGAVASAARLPGCPPDFERRAQALMGHATQVKG